MFRAEEDEKLAKLVLTDLQLEESMQSEHRELKDEVDELLCLSGTYSVCNVLTSVRPLAQHQSACTEGNLYIWFTCALGTTLGHVRRLVIMINYSR